MNFNAAGRRFRKAGKLRLAQKYDEALGILRELVERTSDCTDKARLLYHEVLWLVEIAPVSQAREKLAEMQKQMSRMDGLDSLTNRDTSVAASLPDTDRYDARVDLLAKAHYAEARILLKEGNGSSALSVLEDLATRYPKHLSLSKSRELQGQINMWRGVLLTHSNRELEAGVFLQRAVAPAEYRPMLRFYLGRFYYTTRDYPRAAQNLKGAIGPSTPPRFVCQAHFLLGVAEYHLLHNKEAKKQFDLTIQTADPDFIRRTDVWGWLEKISRLLGLESEAEKYQKLSEEIKRS